MGGSGSGSPSFPGSGGGGRPFDCETFKTRASLRSPRKEVIETLKKGDILRLDLDNDALPILAKTEDNRTAGSIVVAQQQELADCIRTGHVYTAAVLSVEGGSCILDICREEG